MGQDLCYRHVVGLYLQKVISKYGGGQDKGLKPIGSEDRDSIILSETRAVMLKIYTFFLKINIIYKTGGYIYFETSHQPIQTVTSQPSQPSSDSLINAFNLSSLSSNLNTRISSSNALLRPLLSKFPIFQPSPSEPSHGMPVPTSSHLQGPNITDTGPNGLCLSFYYSIDGLSAHNLQIGIKDLETGMNRSIWKSNDEMEAAWVRGEVVYTYGSNHKVCRSKRIINTCISLTIFSLYLSFGESLIFS